MRILFMAAMFLFCQALVVEKSSAQTADSVDGTLSGGSFGGQASDSVDGTLSAGASAAGTEGAVTPPGTMTASAASTSATLTAATDSQIIAAINLARSSTGSDFPFMSTATGLAALQTKIKAYIASTKQTCATTADAAGLMCFEGTSQQAILANKALQYGGPAIALLSSAQKACSSTAELTDTVGKGLALAKGACVVAKGACDVSCSIATGDINSAAAMIVQLTAAIKADHGEAEMYCTSTPMTAVAEASCMSAAAAKFASLNATATALKAAVGTEQVPATPGTSPFMVAKCQGHAADIAMFALNIGNVLNANSSAKKCAEQLGAGGIALTPAEYCKTADNASTSFCKCQKDNSVEGCPGYVAKRTTDPKKDEAGKDTRSSSSGASQFAGGFGDTVKPSAVDLGGIKPDSKMAAGVDNKGDTKSADSAVGPVAGGVGSPGGGKSADSANSKEAVGTEDKKKWSFGNFLGLGGGSSASSGGGKASSSGGISQKTAESVQRQIASEKLRAEISTASGKSNWEKISERYLRNSSSLIVGQ